MNLFIIIYGLLFVALGFLLKAYPNIIVGYKVGLNDKINIQKLSNLFRNSFIIMGILTIIGYFVLREFGVDGFADLVIMLPLMGMAVFVLPLAQIYDENRIKQNFTSVTVITATMLVVGLLITGMWPAKMNISDKEVSVSGMYSTDINISNIEKVELVKYLPNITMKTNGFAVGYFCKGYFDLKRWGNCKLFLTTGSGPYLVITDKQGLKTIINNKDTSVTRNDYHQIKKKIRKEWK